MDRPDLNLAAPGTDRATDLLDGPTRHVLAGLEAASRSGRADLLRARKDLARSVLAGGELAVDPATASIREDATWRAAPAPDDLPRRQVELCSPATEADARAALSSGADTWVADLEDGLVPTWDRLVAAQRVLAGVATAPEADQPSPALVVRPRGLHLDEGHLQHDGAPVSAPVADVGLFLAHCARPLLEAGRTPHLYLPKLESHAEATWWDALLTRAEELLDLPAHSVRVSVLVETVQAAYQLEEIVHALRHRVTALAAGRWDYVFSHLRTYATRPDQVVPDRDSFTMNTRFLRSYTDLIVRTCGRRGLLAIGGPVADVPGGPFEEATLRAGARVRRDKLREARQGFAGAWVLHPALVPVAREAFEQVGSHDLPDHTGPVVVDGEALRDISKLPGTATLSGLRYNIRASLTFLTGWLSGQGTCVIEGHLEDFGTVELARMQVWQWAHHGVRLAEGPTVGPLLIARVVGEEAATLRRRLATADDRIDRAAELLTEAFEIVPPLAFLSQRAYAVLLSGAPAGSSNGSAA
ncbi:malate synthase A [Ornithinicoccus hortensis]|uniref:malate synthase n=1 Tax=Ornithinicoccus hortensis TaxID=82346 RepID=A0A542YRR6_9MICO|nr:malate synthase A [Ornithinicoccus hortensis]TQL50747.1 malate synthase [Ornithinicoccus hortensis]